MDYKSNQSQGYEPKMSSGNNTGYYMDESKNLINMMQTGGQPSSRGAALFAQALQRRSDMDKLEKQQRIEARRQKRGGLFGSVGSLAGSLLGAALAPATAGLSLALFSGLGSAAGKRIGEGLGAGKSKKYDRSGTVYGQQSFRDVEQASRDYTRGMGERALLSGLKTGLTAGLTPGGGIYGKVGGKLRGFGAPVAAPIADTTLMDSLLPQGSIDSLPFSVPKGLQGSFIPAGYGNATSSIDFNSPYTLSLNSYMHGGIAHDDKDYLGFDASRSFSANETDQSDPNVGSVGSGSYTASDILKQAGIAPTDAQLKLFQSFDPTKIQQAKTGAEQSLLEMTGGMGLSSAGGGFGARQKATTSAIGGGQDLIGDTTEQAQRAFESDTLGTAADLVAGGAEFGVADWVEVQPPTGGGSFPGQQKDGADGRTYIWFGNEWIDPRTYFSDQG